MGDPIPPEVAESIFAGRKIEAIKRLREHGALGLKDAKDRVEAMERRLRAERPERFGAAPRSGGCMGVLLAAAALVLAAKPLLEMGP
jgi:hypothetical protein